MKSCAKLNCAGLGHFDEDRCPGSDSEEGMHHCVHCGELTWTDKGEYCECCGDYWCQIGWQNTFTFFDIADCEHVEPQHQSMCAKCLLSKPKLWCTDDSCKCDLKETKLRAEYAAFLAHGSLCGSADLQKAGEKLSLELYRFPGEQRARLVAAGASQEFAGPEALELAFAEAQRLAKTFSPKQNGDDSSEWGYLTGLFQ